MQLNALLEKHKPYSTSDRLDEVLRPFLTKNQRALNQLRDKSKEMLDGYKALCEFFGDDPATESQEFFGRIDEFIKYGERAHKVWVGTSCPLVLTLVL